MYTAVARVTLTFSLQLLYIYKEGPFGFPMCYRESKSSNGKCLYIYIEGWVFVPKCKCRHYIAKKLQIIVIDYNPIIFHNQN